MRPALLLLLALLAAPLAQANDSTLPDWTGLEATKVAGDLAGPMDIALAPDGSIWFAEVYQGNVSRLDPATGRVETKFHVEVVGAFDERGLVGFALDKDFAQNGAFYIYYTKPDPADADHGTNRLSRVEGGKETVLVDDIPAFKRHNGGRIEVASDGSLFVGVGENELGAPAQDLADNRGKVLHLMPDGKPAAGNVRGLVYSSGHRNIYGLAHNARTGELWQTENSGWQRDEVNRIEAGKNYGYPHCEGMQTPGGPNQTQPCPAQYALPLMTFYEGRTAAPTGATWFLGQFVWASWNEGSLHHLWLDDVSKEYKDKVVYDPPVKGFRIADVETSPDGRALYFSTWDEIWKLEFPSLPPGAERAWLGAAAPSPQPTQPPATPSPTTPPPGLPPRTNATGPDTAPVPGFAWTPTALALAAVALLARRAGAGKP